jgi:nucleotide-binding universal stress UspA family protein
MLLIRTILHPTDFSDRSEYALQLACALARDYGARLVVLHAYHMPPAFAGEGMAVLGPEEFRADAEEQLRRLQVPQADVRTERRLEEGEPVSEILRVAGEIGAELIVMGTHGRTGVGRLLMGSVAEQVVRRAVCPVVTVTRPFPPAPGSGGLGTQTA